MIQEIKSCYHFNSLDAVNISFFSEQVELPVLDYAKIEPWVNRIVAASKREVGSISIIFCSDDYLLSINQKFLNHDYFTDVITFNYSSRVVVSGDIFISTDTVLTNSQLFKVNLHDEYLRVIGHGILHLLGFNDTTDQESREMRAMEDFWMDNFSIAPG